MPLIPALGKQRQMDFCEVEPSSGLHSEFQASQGFLVRLCFKTKTKAWRDGSAGKPQKPEDPTSAIRIHGTGDSREPAVRVVL